MPTCPFIARETSLVGIRSTCRLCGAHNVAQGGHFSIGVEAAMWEESHTEACTPDTVRARANGLRDAAEDVLRIARDGDPEVWEHDIGHRALVAVLDGLRVRAAALDIRLDNALNRKDIAA